MAKHHDGFCLWSSRYTDHSVRSSKWQNGQGDVVRQFVDACHEGQMPAAFYLSPWDRHEPSYGDSPRYNQHFVNQLTEFRAALDEIFKTDLCAGRPAHGSNLRGNDPRFAAANVTDGNLDTYCATQVQVLKSGESLQTLQPVVRDSGSAQGQLPQARQPLDVLQPGIREAADKMQTAELAEVREVRQPSVRDFGVAERQVFDARQFLEDRQFIVGHVGVEVPKLTRLSILPRFPQQLSRDAGSIQVDPGNVREEVTSQKILRPTCSRQIRLAVVVTHLPVRLLNRLHRAPLLPRLLQLVGKPAESKTENQQREQQRSQAELKPAAAGMRGRGGGVRGDSAVGRDSKSDRSRSVVVSAGNHGGAEPGAAGELLFAAASCRSKAAGAKTGIGL